MRTGNDEETKNRLPMVRFFLHLWPRGNELPNQSEPAHVIADGSKLVEKQESSARYSRAFCRFEIVRCCFSLAAAVACPLPASGFWPGPRNRPRTREGERRARHGFSSV